MTLMWTIKAVYSAGSHILRDGDFYLFVDKQKAADKVETLNAVSKKSGSETRYIVVPVE